MLKGQRILLTTNSTGDYAVRSCLEEIRSCPERRAVRQSRPGADHLAPSPRTTAISSASGRRTTTRSRKRPAPRYLCTGSGCRRDRAGRADRARRLRQGAARRRSPSLLAVYLRGWGWAKANPAEARAHAEEVLRRGRRRDLRPRRWTRNSRCGPSSSSTSSSSSWIAARAPRRSTAGSRRHRQFMVGCRDLAARRRSRRAFITDEYMKSVAADPKLKAFATEFDKR